MVVLDVHDHQLEVGRIASRLQLLQYLLLRDVRHGGAGGVDVPLGEVPAVLVGLGADDGDHDAVAVEPGQLRGGAEHLSIDVVGPCALGSEAGCLAGGVDHDDLSVQCEAQFDDAHHKHQQEGQYKGHFDQTLAAFFHPTTSPDNRKNQRHVQCWLRCSAL